MAFLYNIGIQAYHLAIQLAAPFNEKAALLRKGRKEVWKKALKSTKTLCFLVDLREKVVWCGFMPLLWANSNKAAR